jgi:hypothetical protein
MTAAIAIPAKIRGDFVKPRIANQESENSGEQIQTVAAVLNGGPYKCQKN